MHAILMILIFVVGYFFITIEHYTKINKATVAILMAILCWIIQFANAAWSFDINMSQLEHHLADISQVIFFLLGALTIVEIINQHKGFQFIAKCITFRSKRKMLWVISLLTFFLSSILDNLTTTVVMVSLLRKLVDENQDRLLIGGAIVIAANAGGAWTPIGDVTTTMLWIGGQLSTLAVIKNLFIPSIVCLVVSVGMLSLALKGNFAEKYVHMDDLKVEPRGKLIFFLGVGALIFVPIFKLLTGLPPFMGILLGLSVLWIVTDIVHSHDEQRQHLRVPNIMTKVDLSGILFFLGILLSVNALYTAGLLGKLAVWLNENMANLAVISFVIGLASAVVDNVPLVAASMGMYGLDQYPTDHDFWNMVAFCAGTGGSILIVGSAAGVVFMGMEKVDFLWYVRRISFPALAGYIAGFIAYCFGCLLM